MIALASPIITLRVFPLLSCRGSHISQRDRYCDTLPQHDLIDNRGARHASIPRSILPNPHAPARNLATAVS